MWAGHWEPPCKPLSGSGCRAKARDARDAGSQSCQNPSWGSAVLPTLLLWCPSLVPGVWSRIGALWGEGVPAQEGSDKQGEGVVGPGPAYVIMIFCFCQPDEWGLSVSVPSVSPESTCHDFKNLLVFIPPKVLGCSPCYLTSHVSKQSALQALAVLQLVCHLRYFFLPTFFLMISYWFHLHVVFSLFPFPSHLISP